MILGRIMLKEFLEKTEGKVRGTIQTDAKRRYYAADYAWKEDTDGWLYVTRVSSSRRNNAAPVKLRSITELDESLIALLGLYSGDGAKGSEDAKEPGRIHPNISISQIEPHLVRFAVEQLRRLFPGTVHFAFSLGEDSALFMAGPWLEELKKYYGGRLPPTQPLSQVRPELDEADKRFLLERRNVPGTNEEHLAFYYQHKAAMEVLLAQVKRQELESVALTLQEDDVVDASLRRPFKKGAREMGGSSRADEVGIRGVPGMGELLLKMMHEVEESIRNDSQTSAQGLVEWNGVPSSTGELIDVKQFFLAHEYGRLGKDRPTFLEKSFFPDAHMGYLCGRWPRSSDVYIKPSLRIDPLWCYTSGLYLAEGRSDKSCMLSMFREGGCKGLGLGFTSSENDSLELMLKTLQRLFLEDECVDAWKVKVGSQYFPELVVIGLKNGVPMLRGGRSGDGKLRTMEISLAIRDWALKATPAMIPYADKYSHVEPTGAGVPRIDMWASSAICRWYFPFVIYAAFGNQFPDPRKELQ